MIEVISRDEAREKGLKRYFTGEACKHGHIDERIVSTTMCATCSKARSRLIYVKNADARKAKAKLYRDQNKDKVKESLAAYRIENAEKISITQAAYRDKNRDKRRMESLQWAKENPQKMRDAARNRRAAKAKAEGTHTKKDIEDLFFLQQGRCATCIKKIFFTAGKVFHVDHIVALVNGGSNDKRNLQLLCPLCNCRKGKMDPLDWASQNGKLL